MSKAASPILSRWMNLEFSPWASRYVYWLRTPLGVLVLAAFASLLCGLLVAVQGFVIAAAAAVVIVLGIAWPWLALRGMACELSFRERRSREGQPVGVTASIINRWPWPVWGLEIERGFFAATAGQEGETVVSLARVGGWSRAEFQWEYVPTVRGVYPSSVPQLATSFPFGLWKATTPITVVDRLVVWPQTFSLDWFPLPAGARRWLGAISPSHSGNDGERSGVRPWREGDTLRSIHWALTARHNRFIVCERHGTTQAQAIVRVDTLHAAHVGEGTNSTLEWSLRIASSFGELLLELGIPVTLELVGEPLQLAPGPAAARRMLDCVASFDASSRRIGTTSLNHQRRGEQADWMVEVVTDRSKSPAASKQRNVQRIVLQTKSLTAMDCQPRAGQEELPVEGIVIDMAHSIPEQLARLWRRRSAEVWRGA